VPQVDATYFESYSYFSIHREMLGDIPRTSAYRTALEANPGLLRGARVLDVGCGTGILSLFAARAGADAVVGVDGSARMAGVAASLAAANGYGPGAGGEPGVVTIVSGKIEDLEVLPLEQFDVIVSEWMGYCLLFESMLDTVLDARDRFLKPGGALLPDVATFHIAGVTRVRSAPWRGA
jgi:protein arginine N-methyltransferase 3